MGITLSVQGLTPYPWEKGNLPQPSVLHRL